MARKTTSILAALLISALALAQEQQTVGEEAKEKQANIETLRKFMAVLPAAGINLSVIHLNRVTVDILFPQQKQAWKTRARLNTLFFIQGVADKDTNFDPSFVAIQGGNSYKGSVLTPINNTKFALGPLIKGDMVQGIISFDRSLDVNKPFKLVNNENSVEIQFEKKNLEMLKEVAQPASTNQ